MSRTYTFDYNGYGQRIQKKYTFFPGLVQQLDYMSSKTINYTYDNNGRLIKEYHTLKYSDGETITRSIVYLYDESDVVGMAYTNNGSTNVYYFNKNIFGDVIEILDISGNIVVRYKYDAWGNCTTTTANYDIAEANPFRYRSYYYDEDTELYYLNARYYNPKWRRFISPDGSEYIDPESVNGLNLYAYCNNDPVNYADPSGHGAILTAVLIGTLVGFGMGFGINAGNQLISNDLDFSKVNWGVAVNVGIVGAGLGFSLAMGVAYLGPAIAGSSVAGGLSVAEALGISTTVSFLAGAFGYASEEWINERTPSFEKAIVHGGFVALEGMVKFGVGGMTGSVGNIGTKGKFLTSIEWWGKLALGLEFSHPFKILIDYLRNSVLYK